MRIVDATLIAAPRSTKNQEQGLVPEMHPSTKGTQWYVDMNVHIGVDSRSRLIHMWGFAKVRYRGTATNANRALAMLAMLNIVKWAGPITRQLRLEYARDGRKPSSQLQICRKTRWKVHSIGNFNKVMATGRSRGCLMSAS